MCVCVLKMRDSIVHCTSLLKLNMAVSYTVVLDFAQFYWVYDIFLSTFQVFGESVGGG